MLGRESIFLFDQVGYWGLFEPLFEMRFSIEAARLGNPSLSRERFGVSSKYNSQYELHIAGTCLSVNAIVALTADPSEQGADGCLIGE